MLDSGGLTYPPIPFLLHSHTGVRSSSARDCISSKSGSEIPPESTRNEHDSEVEGSIGNEESGSEMALR